MYYGLHAVKPFALRPAQVIASISTELATPGAKAPSPLSALPAHSIISPRARSLRRSDMAPAFAKQVSFWIGARTFLSATVSNVAQGGQKCLRSNPGFIYEESKMRIAAGTAASLPMNLIGLGSVHGRNARKQFGEVSL